jgi:hypothetical protein
MPNYHSKGDIEPRLRGKVRFTDDEADENKMHVRLLSKLQDEAEAQVEMDLSPRYEVPFQTVDGAAFEKLPTLTRTFIRTMCELQSIIRILETDFGRGSASDGSKYTDALQKRYDKMRDDALQKRKHAGEETMQFARPPLPGIMLAAHNEGDDGFLGEVMTSSRGDGDYPAKQIDDPSETFASWGLDA